MRETTSPVLCLLWGLLLHKTTLTKHVFRNTLSENLNPYAPVDATGLNPLPEPIPEEFNGLELAWNTFFYVTLSGGVFGFGLVTLGALISFVVRLIEQKNPLGLLFAVFPGAIAALIGMCLAAIGAMLVVPAAYMIVKLLSEPKADFWNGTTVRLFGATCGFVTGWICLAVPGLAMGELGFLGIGLVPATVGSIATTLMLNRTAKRANRILDRRFNDQLSEEDQIDPLSAI